MSTQKLDLPQPPRRRRSVRVAVLTAVLALLAGVAWTVVGVDGGQRVTAYFTSAVGIYPNSDVRVLGVRIGSVNTVQPVGDRVRVDLTVESDVDLPANASALVVTPSVVADRYIQLAPVYTGGPTLDDGAEIPVERTATPVELDELFRSINDITVALGPSGANADGAVNELLLQSAQTLQGNGRALGESIRQLGEFARTLKDSKDNLAVTIDKLSAFTATLAANDQQAGQAIDQLAAVSQVLAEDRDDLGAALGELNEAVGVVQGFIHDNRGRVQSNVDKLAGITQILADQKASLSEALDTAPNALTNVVEAYNPATGTIDGRGNLNEFRVPLPLSGPAQTGAH